MFTLDNYSRKLWPFLLCGRIVAEPLACPARKPYSLDSSSFCSIRSMRVAVFRLCQLRALAMIRDSYEAS